MTGLGVVHLEGLDSIGLSVVHNWMAMHATVGAIMALPDTLVAENER